LQLYQFASGQKVNSSKSHLYYNVDSVSLGFLHT